MLNVIVKQKRIISDFICIFVKKIDRNIIAKIPLQSPIHTNSLKVTNIKLKNLDISILLRLRLRRNSRIVIFVFLGFRYHFILYFV